MGQYYLKRASLGLIKEIRHGLCLRKVSYSSFIHIKEKPDNTVRFLTSRYKKVHGSLTQYAIGLIITTQAKKNIYIYVFVYSPCKGELECYPLLVIVSNTLPHMQNRA